MKYRGDKYVKAYQFYRTKQDEKLSNLALQIKEIERTLEWLCGHILPILEELKK